VALCGPELSGCCGQWLIVKKEASHDKKEVERILKSKKKDRKEEK